MEENENRNLSSWLKLERTKLDFIQRDIEELGLDENCEISIITAEEIEGSLENEFPDYNVDITEVSSSKNNIVVIGGYSTSEEKDVKLYYYEDRESLVRQLREYNYKGELKGIKRAAIFEDGKYSELDEGSVSYAYDENGFKKYAKIDNPFGGEQYFIYNEDGKAEFEITDEYVRQWVTDGDKEYIITDGYFKPNDNGGFTYLPSKPVEELKNEDIKRVVYGDISGKDSIVADLTEERKEQIINAIRLNSKLEWITQEVELDYVEEVENEKIEHPTPGEVVEESIRETVENLRKSGRPYRFEQFIEDSKLEQHIGRTYGGNEFLEKLLQYANRKMELKERTDLAKDLLNEYEQQSSKDGQTQSDEN